MTGRAWLSHAARAKAAWETATREAARLDTAVARIAASQSPFMQMDDFRQVLGQLAPDGIEDGPPAQSMLPPPAGSVLLQVEERLAAAADRGRALNAFIDIWPDRARDQARALDAAAAADLPLKGMVVAHKDCLRIAGRAMTAGAAFPADEAEPGETATVVGRLEAAGAVTIGALHMSEFVAGPTGQNPHWGPCLNPHSPDHIAGGSSSGSAVAVAAGIVDGSLGSDTGGSIRLPASACGCVGLKPTWGKVSRHGCFPRAPSLDCVGPIARSVADCARLLAVVAGPDPLDPSSLTARVAGGAARPSGTALARIGTLAEDCVAPLDADVRAAFRSALALVEGRGHPVREVRCEGFADLYTLGDVVSKVEAAALHARWMRTRGPDYSNAVFNRTIAGFDMSAASYAAALALRGTLLRDFVATAFDDADLLLCPTMPVAVPRWEDVDMEAGTSVFPVVAEISRLTRPFNYLGLPVLSLPMGRDRQGMPIGLQVIGRPFAEAQILGFAGALEAWLSNPGETARPAGSPPPGKNQRRQHHEDALSPHFSPPRGRDEG